MSSFTGFNPRSFGLAAFTGAAAITGAVGSAGVRGVQQSSADLAYRGSRQRVAARLRSMRAEARDHALEASSLRLESMIRLHHIKRLERASRA